MHKTWEDEEFMELSPDAKVLFLWAFTYNKRASMTGITEVSMRKMRNVLSAPEQEVERVLVELASKPFLLYDFDFEVLWVIRRCAYAHSKSPRWLAGLRSHVDSLPQKSLLVERFRELYKPLLEGV